MAGEAVGRGDRQQLEAVATDIVEQFPDVDRQFAEAGLDRDFPEAGHTYSDARGVGDHGSGLRSETRAVVEPPEQRVAVEQQPHWGSRSRSINSVTSGGVASKSGAIQIRPHAPRAPLDRGAPGHDAGDLLAAARDADQLAAAGAVEQLGEAGARVTDADRLAHHVHLDDHNVGRLARTVKGDERTPRG